MVERNIIIRLQHGLQARLATKLVEKASSFNSEITIIKTEDQKPVKALWGL